MSIESPRASPEVSVAGPGAVVTGAATSQRLMATAGRGWRPMLRDHVLAILLCSLLAVGLTWPTVSHFTTSLTSDGGDARHHLWHLWRARQVLAGQQPALDAPLVYYPVGASPLTHSLGFVTGLLSLPFWPLGPEAAWNGAVLLGFALSGYCTYLLARDLRLGQAASLFAGLVLLAAPIHLAGLLGHLTKVFLGLMPLTLLALHRALDPRRSGWWCLATAAGLLALLFTHGYQFVYTGLALGFFAAAALLGAARSERGVLLRRLLLVGLATGLLVGPGLLAILQAAHQPGLQVESREQALDFRPDLAWLVLPAPRSVLHDLLRPAIAGLQLSWGKEPELSVPWTVLLLTGFGLLAGGRAARRWALFALGVVVLALGPALRAFGQTSFTAYDLPLMLPYALVTSLPGLEFVRVPTRFMLLGAVGFGLAAGYGLLVLARRTRLPLGLLATLAGLLVLVETWPRPWPQERLRPAPAFYQQLATDPASYGVFDLPIAPRGLEPYASTYQIFQLTHGKGIHSAYFSRTYRRNPLFPCLFSYGGSLPDVRVDGVEVDCLQNLRFELAQYGYRYLVWHQARPGFPDFQVGSAEQRRAEVLIRAVFADQPPINREDAAVVYAVEPAPPLESVALKLELADNWTSRSQDAPYREAESPAGLKVTSPRQQTVSLLVTAASISDQDERRGWARPRRLTASRPDGWTASTEIALGQTASLEVPLQPGLDHLDLTFAPAGPAPAGGRDDGPERPSFPIRRIELRSE